MAKIFIYDEFNPEDSAMMQALYSRSPKSVTEHVEKVKASGSGKFMETFYVGYGHASIADCGSTTMFIEGISILADKAIQDWQLYSGQETSTRYIDMSKQAIIDPLATSDSQAILQQWMNFYVNHQEKIQNYLQTKYPKKADEDEAVYLKAIKARGFDIMRGFLPAGITTQLSWHSNLRQAWDKLALMRYHPLAEIKDIANEILRQLKDKYPHSFSHAVDEIQEKYRADMMSKYNYYRSKNATDFSFYSTIRPEKISKYQDAFFDRPPKTGLPNFLNDLGTCTFEFLLDFGSFRDIQRHRNGTCRMPLLTTEYGFNNWYLEQLPEDLKMEAVNLINSQKILIDKLNTSPEIKQYYIALGFNVFCRNTYPLTAAAYVIELRSGRAVHPTLRKVAHKMAKAVELAFPNFKLYCDLSLDDWDIRRGSSDIISKAPEITSK